jgi:hypothetical protein
VTRGVFNKWATESAEEYQELCVHVHEIYEKTCASFVQLFDLITLKCANKEKGPTGSPASTGKVKQSGSNDRRQPKVEDRREQTPKQLARQTPPQPQPNPQSQSKQQEIQSPNLKIMITRVVEEHDGRLSLTC